MIIVFGDTMTRKLAFKAFAMIDFEGNSQKTRVELVAFERDSDDKRNGLESYVNIGGDVKNGVQGTLFLSDNPKAPAKFSEVVGESPLLDDKGNQRVFDGKPAMKKIFGDTLLLYPRVVAKDGSALKKADGTSARPFAAGVSRTPEQALNYTLARLAVKEASTKGPDERRAAEKNFNKTAKTGSHIPFIVTNGRNKLHLPGPDTLEQPRKNSNDNEGLTA